MWPFSRFADARLTGDQLRDRLLDAGLSGRPKTIRKACRRYHRLVPQHAETLATLPPDLRDAPEAVVQRSEQALRGIAYCLASEFSTPQLQARLDTLAATETPSLADTSDDAPSPSDPRPRISDWCEAFADRLAAGEVTALATEGAAYSVELTDAEDEQDRMLLAGVAGRLADVLLHSGCAGEAIDAAETSVAIYQELGEPTGELAGRTQLIECHRALQNGEAAAAAALLLDRCRELGVPASELDSLDAMVARLQQGEPPLRAVIVRDGVRHEAGDIAGPVPADAWDVARDRPDLLEVTQLLEAGDSFAATEPEAALDLYAAAAEVDLDDPRPIIATGLTLLQTRDFEDAVAAFEAAEELAPRWPRVRSLVAVASELARGVWEPSVGPQVAALHQTGVLPPGDIPPVPLLLAGMVRVLAGDEQPDAAIDLARRVLDVTDEPDLRSRLLVDLGDLLPPGDPERGEIAAEVAALPADPITAARASRLLS